MIPIAKPDIGDKEKKAILEVMDTGMLAQGEYVDRFEKGFGELTGVKNAVATSSGTTALYLALRALGIGQGDEVITTPFSFIATASTIRMVGAVPVFADIERDTYNIDPREIEKVLSDKTRAILPVHLYGLPARMDAIMDIAEDNDLLVLEDACQAHGSSYKGKMSGSIGHAAAFSFYPTKNMTTGEGGMVTTNDDDIAERLRLLRNHGQVSRYQYGIIGYNMRLTNLAAAIGLAQLEKVEDYNHRRRENAAKFDEMLEGVVEIPGEYDDAKHVYHQYTIALKDRKERESVMASFEREKIGYGIYYPAPLYQYEPLKDYAVEATVTEEMCSRVLSIPVHPGVGAEEAEQIGSAIKNSLE